MSSQYTHAQGGIGQIPATNQSGQGQGQNWPDIFGIPQQRQQQQQQQTQPQQQQNQPSIQSAMNDQSYPASLTSHVSAWQNGGGAGGGGGGSYPNPGASQPMYPTLSNDTTHQHPPPGTGSDPVLHFFNTMPSSQEDPSRHALWTELVRLKTRALELQIAEAKAKEKEAETELYRLKEIYRSKGGRHSFSQSLTSADVTQSQGMSQYNTTGAAPGSTTPFNAFAQSTLHATQPFNPDNMTTSNMQTPIQNTSNLMQLAPDQVAQQQQQQQQQQPTSMTTFDLEAMMQNNNLDNMFSWLPDFGDSSQTLQRHSQGARAGGVDPNDLLMSNGNVDSTGHPFQTFYNPTISTPMSVKPNITSPPTRRSRTPDDDEPASKKVKRPEKKTAVDYTSSCTICSKPLAKAIVRAPKSQIPETVSVEFACPDCRPVPSPPSLNDVASGSGIGTVDTRKRLRIAMETEDEDKKDVEERRAFCDVCQRVFGSGMIFGGQERENLGHMTEIICTSCDAKYSRCTDCGGGGGGRMGIGKWRMKQVFQPGRKTCSLSHTRLGDRPREIGVHVTPTDFTPEQLKEVLSRCKQLWNEKTLARLAVPEMLEIDLPSQLMNPIRNYADVEDIVTQNWPNRESMIRAEGADPARFKRLLGLVWAHSKSRRGTRTVDLEEDWHKNADGGDDDDMSTVLDNVKRTNLVIPGGSELIGMWGGEWDLKHGALLVSTFIPFEGTDGEDSTALSVGEMITKVQTMRQAMNQERKAEAAKLGQEPDLVPQCEHLWVVSGGAMPLVRERIADILIRKRSFVHVDEYLTRHPDFINALNARPVGLHPDILRVSPHTVETRAPPLILVRWLGKDFDAQKIQEIKQAEFGGKSKLKKKQAKGK